MIYSILGIVIVIALDICLIYERAKGTYLPPIKDWKTNIVAITILLLGIAVLIAGILSITESLMVGIFLIVLPSFLFVIVFIYFFS